MAPKKRVKKRVAARKATTSKRSKFDPNHYESSQSWDIVGQCHFLSAKVTPNTESPIEPEVKRILGKIKICPIFDVHGVITINYSL